MKHKVYIFDFDGTLVHSNAIKREAFYQLSPTISNNHSSVDKILSLIPERSRYEIINAIYTDIETLTQSKFSEAEIASAIEQYSKLVWEGVSSCPELEGAFELLSTIKKSGSLIYISSNTPEISLRELVAARKWAIFIEECFGFPKQKKETVQFILKSKHLEPSEIIVIGDGLSDEVSAKENGCDFFKISNPQSLIEFRTSVNSSHHYV